MNSLVSINRNIRRVSIVAGIIVITAAPVAANAGEMVYSGFMTDYSQLEKVTDGSADYRYVAPGGEDRMSKYRAVMIDQPEVFIANDSAYRGAKPKHLDALAEALRTGIASALSEDLYVVDQPGDDVLYISLAITNLKLNKRKRGILGYTPQGFVIGSIAGAATSDIAKKADLAGLVFELEAFDSVSGDRVVAIIDAIGDAEDQPTSWEELESLMTTYGKLIQCRFDNAPLPPEQRANCLAEAS
jgi:hypothetical protein